MTLKPPSSDALAASIASHDEQLRRTRTMPTFTWDNFRFGGYTVSFSGGDGYLTFDPEFDNECFGSTATARAVTGFAWIINIKSVSRQRLFMNAWQHDPGNPVGFYTGDVVVQVTAMGW